jgi:hypothetical protein
LHFDYSEPITDSFLEEVSFQAKEYEQEHDQQFLFNRSIFHSYHIELIHYFYVYLVQNFKIHSGLLDTPEEGCSVDLFDYRSCFIDYYQQTKIQSNLT